MRAPVIGFLLALGTDDCTSRLFPEPDKGETGTGPLVETDDVDEECDPATSAWVDGRCVPSCGTAGGDTCTDASTTLCEGLTLLESYDCAVCCDGPTPVTPRAVSFHVIDKDDTYAWDAIWSLYSSLGATMITSQNRPDWLSPQDWAQNISTSWYGSGEEMAEAIHAGLVHEESAPHYVLVDELGTSTVDLIAQMADTMRTRYPQWAGRWGVWLVNGESVSYARLNPAIDALLYANAVLVPEMYARQSSYCDAAETAGDRDIWLGDFFSGRGSGFEGRMYWLVNRRTWAGSTSRIVPAFGVVDTYMDGTDPSVFLDRMFYVWRTRSGYPSSIDLTNGGAGAWKWDQVDGSEYGMSNTSRDLAFSESFMHYAVDRSSESLKGQVDCD